MALASGSEAPAQAPPTGPASTSRALGAGVVKLGRRFLMLREGSIIVVTALTIVYFAATTSGFSTGANLKALLPYFAPIAVLGAGIVFVMVLGVIR